MLLGSTANNNAHFPGAESLIMQLILQQRYAELYEMLSNQQPASTDTLYNMALCLHWSGNYQGALSKLESIQPVRQLESGNKVNTDNDYKQIKNKQNQTDDYLQGMSEMYIKNFPAMVYDAILRLKIDCWLHLGNYAKVITLSAPIAHKGYKNITDALKLADEASDKRI